MAARVLGVKRAIRVSRQEAEALIIDCTEQPIQRPGRKQRCWYSGKKKRHTIKTEIVITENGRIVSVSKPTPGRVHDLEIRRRGPPLPSASHVYADSGYQGLQDDHSGIDIPYKKTKVRPLTKDERSCNLTSGNSFGFCASCPTGGMPPVGRSVILLFHESNQTTMEVTKCGNNTIQT